MGGVRRREGVAAGGRVVGRVRSRDRRAGGVEDERSAGGKK